MRRREMLTLCSCFGPSIAFAADGNRPESRRAIGRLCLDGGLCPDLGQPGAERRSQSIERSLQEPFAWLNRLFGVRTTLMVFEGSPCSPTASLEQRTVAFGAEFFQRLTGRFRTQTMFAALAHEVAHHYQARSDHGIDDFGITSEEPLVWQLPRLNVQRGENDNNRTIELHADFLAGWACWRRGITIDAASFLVDDFFSRGDLEFRNTNFHGRGHDRRISFASGYQVQGRDLMMAAWAGIDLVRRLPEDEGD